MNNLVQIIIAVVVGIAVGIFLMKVAGKMGLDQNKKMSQDIIDEANSKAETVIRQANLDGKQQVYEMKLQA